MGKFYTLSSYENGEDPLFNGYDYDQLDSYDFLNEFEEYFDESDFDDYLNDNNEGIDFSNVGGSDYSFAEALYDFQQDLYYDAYDSWKHNEADYYINDVLYYLYNGSSTSEDVLGETIVYIEDEEDDEDDENEIGNEVEEDNTNENSTEWCETPFEEPEFENLFDSLIE